MDLLDTNFNMQRSKILDIVEKRPKMTKHIFQNFPKKNIKKFKNNIFYMVMGLPDLRIVLVATLGECYLKGATLPGATLPGATLIG